MHLRPAICVGFATLLLTAAAFGQAVLPPTFTKAFTPTSIPANGTTSSELRFSITNPNQNTDITGLTFTDTLPVGLSIVPGSQLGSCGAGVIVVTTTSISLTNGSLTSVAGGFNNCQFIVLVTTTTAGVYLNTTSDLTSSAGTATAATATLTAVGAPTITKGFGAAAIDINQVTPLTITITNPNTTVALTGVAVTDTLPAGIVVAAPLAVTNTCGGTVTAVAGGNSVALAGGSLAVSASCTITVNVVGFTNGTSVNTTGAVTSTEGGTGLTATATIVVNPIIDDLGVYQVRYLANLNQGDSFVNFTNAGTLNGFDPAGRICVNVYTFDPAEELISCCACPVTPNGLNSLSARNDLISNTLTPGVPTAVTVKLVATVPGAGGLCNPSTPTAQTVVRGMRAWATTLHLNTSGSPAVGYQETETRFSAAELSVTELTKLTGFCGFIQANGSGFGICKSCRAGALGAVQQ